MGTIASTRFGVATATIGSLTCFTTGSCECGIEGSTEFGRVAELAVPNAVVFSSRQPFITVACAEVSGAALSDLWDIDITKFCDPTDKTPTDTTCTLVHGATTYTITAGVVTSYGSVSFGETETAGVSVTYTGYDPNGAGGCGTVADA